TGVGGDRRRVSTRLPKRSRVARTRVIRLRRPVCVLPKHRRKEGGAMTYELKPLGCNPAKLKGLSEKLIVSHYKNNCGCAVKLGTASILIGASASVRFH